MQELDDCRGKNRGLSQDSYLDLSLADFLKALASAEPVPGGGAAAALVGALGAALGSMVARLTLGSERCADVHEQAQILLERTEALRSDLAQMVDEDARAFASVSEALKLPKGTPEEQKVRKERLDEALVAAMDAPRRVIELALEVAECAEEAARIGNANVVSDAGVCAALAHAAAQSARLNVMVNAAWLARKELAEDALCQAARLVESCEKATAAALETTCRRLGLS